MKTKTRNIMSTALVVVVVALILVGTFGHTAKQKTLVREQVVNIKYSDDGDDHEVIVWDLRDGTYAGYFNGKKVDMVVDGDFFLLENVGRYDRYWISRDGKMVKYQFHSFFRETVKVAKKIKMLNWERYAHDWVEFESADSTLQVNCSNFFTYFKKDIYSFKRGEKWNFFGKKKVYKISKKESQKWLQFLDEEF